MSWFALGRIVFMQSVLLVGSWGILVRSIGRQSIGSFYRNLKGTSDISRIYGGDITYYV